MGIFRLRPLAAACILLILTVATAFVLPDTAALACICVCAALLVASVVWMIVKGKTYTRLLLFLLLLGVFLGLGRVWFRQLRTEAAIGDAIHTTVTAEIEVEGINSRTSYSSAILVKIKALNGERTSVRALLVTDGISPYYVGDRLQGSFYCQTLEECTYYEGQEKEYIADGAVVALTPEGKPALVKDGTRSIGALLNDLRDVLHHRLTSVVSGEEGELLSALLFGTKDRLDGSTVRNFRRMGLSHLLALSGLHLGMIGMLADRLLFLLRVGRRWRIPTVAFVCVAYLCLTGFTFSMLRAVLMLSVLYLSFYIKGDYDALTSLSLVGALILLWQPYAVLDLSFQMTVLATFGILAFGDLQGRLRRLLPDRHGIVGFGMRQLRRLLASLLLTVSATLALLPVQWLVFGEISLLTPLSNLIMVPLCVPILISGFVVTALSASPLLAGACGRLAALLPRLMLGVAARVATVDCMLSLRYGFVPFILIPMLVLTFAVLATRLKRAHLLVWIPSVLAIVAFAVCLPLGSDETQAVYRNTGRNEGLLLVKNGDVIVCDLSNGSQNQLYADYRLAQSLCATDVDVLMLTHYHSRHTVSLGSFASAVLVRELWLPPPADEEDRVLLQELLAIAEREHIAVRQYGYGEVLSVFEGEGVALAEPLFEKRSVEPALMLTVEGEQRLTYMSAAYSEYARKTGTAPIPFCENLILGGHGPVPHEAILPVLEALPQQIVLSNEDILLLFEPVDQTQYVLAPTEWTFTLSKP